MWVPVPVDHRRSGFFRECIPKTAQWRAGETLNLGLDFETVAADWRRSTAAPLRTCATNDRLRDGAPCIGTKPPRVRSRRVPGIDFVPTKARAQVVHLEARRPQPENPKGKPCPIREQTATGAIAGRPTKN